MQTYKKQAILNAALHLFTERGFHGTPTSLIAKKAGVATGTLFHYFETKEVLINKLYLSIKESLLQAITSGIDVEVSIRGKCRRMWLNDIKWAMENPIQHQFYVLFSSSPFISKTTIDEAMSHWQFAFDIIEEGQRLDIIKTLPLDFLMDIGTGILTATAFHFIQNPEKFNDDVYQEKAFETFWDSIRV